MPTPKNVPLWMIAGSLMLALSLGACDPAAEDTASAPADGTDTPLAEDTAPAETETASPPPDPGLIIDPPYMAAATKIDGARVQAADEEPHNWLAHGRTYSEQRYSPLDEINDSNVAGLGLAWSYDTGTIRGLEASPIVVDGLMFATGTWSRVYALNAKTGEELWTFDPEVPGEWARFACCDVVNRGVAVWQGRVYVASLDGRLFALDASNGEVVWEVDTIERQTPYTITGAPRIINGNVIIGNGGAEYGVRGYITAYNAETGEQNWRFYTVPGDPSKPVEHPELEAAMKTWSTGGTDHKWWEVGGGGTAWDSMAYDPDLNLLYVGTGNGAPWNRWVRSPGGGDNLYLSSILALNPDTGRMAWSYQTTPGDTWDYTATQHMILAELKIDGAMRKVIMQAPKNGFFYVLDRDTGKLISADAYAKVTWAKGVDLETGRPIENEELIYKDEAQAVFPGPGGAHNWYPMAFNPETGLVYIPVHDQDFIFNNEAEAFEYRPGEWNTGNSFSTFVEVYESLDLDITAQQGTGRLKAWDPVARQTVWTKDHATVVNGGLLTTAGNLVFQGSGDGQFFAFEADTGEVAWSANVKTGIIAPPVTYAVDGEQYVAVLAGWGGGGAATTFDPKLAHHDYGNDGRILTFKLGGDPDIPQPENRRTDIPKPPVLEATAEQITQGKKHYHRHCAVCHGLVAVGPYEIPDLRYSDASIHEAYEDIVLDGLLKNTGMASFADALNAEDVGNIRAYVLSEAWTHYNKQEEAKAGEE